MFKQNINKIRDIFIKTVKLIGERNWDKEIDTLQVIFIIKKWKKYKLIILYYKKISINSLSFQILSQSSNVSSHSLWFMYNVQYHIYHTFIVWW